MDNISIETIKKIISVIKRFNKNNDIKYIDVDGISNLEDFLKINSEFILETIDYINVYIDIYNKLNSLNINGVYVSCNDIYDPNYLELLIDSYINNSNNYIIRNILYNQSIIIYESLEKCKKDIFLINKVLNLYYELFEINNINIYNKYMEELIQLLDGDNEEDGGEPLDELLNQLSITLKNSYGLKKKNIKVKMLKR